ncbi:hypothetical protein ABPG72_002037 [Tetrahymena utriculariae]
MQIEVLKEYLIPLIHLIIQKFTTKRNKNEFYLLKGKKLPQKQINYGVQKQFKNKIFSLSSKIKSIFEFVTKKILQFLTLTIINQISIYFKNKSFVNLKYLNLTIQLLLKQKISFQIKNI